jgi:hypothetical protein
VSIAVALGIFVPIGLALAGRECWGWLGVWSRGLVRSAARRLPAPARADVEAEWLAELDSFDDRRLAGLVWALDLRVRAASRMRRDGCAARRDSSSPDPLPPRRVHATSLALATLLERQGGAGSPCPLCGAPLDPRPHVFHAGSLATRGSPDNVVAVCSSCNGTLDRG